MSAVTDKLPSYPSGLDIYPESYTIRITKDQLCPIQVMAKSVEYKAIFQHVLKRPDTLFDTDDESKPCFVVDDSLIIYLVEEDDKIYIRTEDGAKIKTDDKKLMDRAITVLTATKRAELDEKAREENRKNGIDASKKELEDLGVVMYDHPLEVGGDITATEIAELYEASQNE